MSNTTAKNGEKSIFRIEPQAKATVVDSPVQCWAHTKAGIRCTVKVSSREGEPIPIPYCSIHLKSGDGALKVVRHPFAGKCLVARFDLPANYRMAFYGTRGRCPTSDREDRSISYYPPNPKTGSNYYPFRSRTLRIDNYNGVIHPDHRDCLQYAACPGPGERQNVKSNNQYFGLRNGKRAGLEFIAIEPIAKNTQLCHWYGPGWWSARDVKRQNVGTDLYPAPKRKKLNFSST